MISPFRDTPTFAILLGAWLVRLHSSHPPASSPTIRSEKKKKPKVTANPNLDWPSGFCYHHCMSTSAFATVTNWSLARPRTAPGACPCHCFICVCYIYR